MAGGEDTLQACLGGVNVPPRGRLFLIDDCSQHGDILSRLPPAGFDRRSDRGRLAPGSASVGFLSLQTLHLQEPVLRLEVKDLELPHYLLVQTLHSRHLSLNFLLVLDGDDRPPNPLKTRTLIQIMEHIVEHLLKTRERLVSTLNCLT